MGVTVRLGDFLAARRAALSPTAAGLEPSGRRRVPGLRRQELAELAGVSVDYLVRLEQNRATHPSPEVLDALARALQLDETERRHLHDLAAPARRRRAAPPERVHPQVLRLLEQLAAVPAVVLGRRLDILAQNRLARALYGDAAERRGFERNMAWWVFLDPAARALYADWDEVARATVGALRHQAGRHPDDPAICALVGELSVKSGEFARLWASHVVREKSRGRKRFRHPVVGELELHYETLALRAEADQLLVTYTAAPGSPSETALQLLAAWAEPMAPEPAAT